MSSSNLVLGLIGCGYWGPNLLRNYRALEGVRVKTVVDRDAARRTFVTQRYSDIRVGTDADEILTDPSIGAVSIATPAASHAELAERALAAGKDVFVEKPLALSSTEAARLTRLADDKGRVLMVGHTFLFNEAVRELKRRVQAGEVGRVHYLYSRRLNLGIVREDVNVAWNLAPHDISIANYLLEEAPKSASAKGVSALRPESGVQDVAFISLTYPSGVVLHTQVSWLDPRKERTMTVVGDRRMIVYDDVGPDKLFIYDKGVTLQNPVPEEQTADFARFRTITRAGDLTIPNLRVPEPLLVESQHFVDCVRTRTRPLTDGWSGVEVAATLEAIDRSLTRDGAPEDVHLPLREPE